MEFLLGKKFKKSKTKDLSEKGKTKEEEKIRKQLEKEMKRKEKEGQRHKSDQLKGGAHGASGQHLGQI
jgi:hypothetical protein